MCFLTVVCTLWGTLGELYDTCCGYGGSTWRKTDRPSGLQHSMHQAQGHLCLCTVAGPNDSKLSIWITEDYGTNNWTLKHTVTTRILFGRINIRFGFLDFVDEDIVIIVHP